RGNQNAGENVVKIMKRTHIVALVVAGLVASSGCMIFCPKPSPERSTAFGKVEFLDFAACRRLSVVEQTVERNKLGNLVVKVEWFNKATKPFKGRVQVAFYDKEKKKEAGAYRWDRHRFSPGHSTVEWVSRTPEAVRYLIQVRKAH
ncbi:MAG: hypothetical protein KGZ25_05845, partial [Planctomycetes bacterium]|nr:hypothetical protein [Planctomycetota bacterium]